MMSMFIFYVFLAAESEFDIRFSSSRLAFPEQEVEIFAFLQKIEKKDFEQKWAITIFWMFFTFF